MIKNRKSFFAACLSIILIASSLSVSADDLVVLKEENTEKVISSGYENVSVNSLSESEDAVPVQSANSQHAEHRMGFRSSGITVENPKSALRTQSELPSEFCYSYDSSEENYRLTPSTDQAESNLCWDFAMLACAESNILKEYGEPVNLSEKQVAFSRFADAQDAKGNLVKEDYRSLYLTNNE